MNGMEMMLVALATLLVALILGVAIGMLVVQLQKRAELSRGPSMQRAQGGWYLELWNVDQGLRFSTTFYGGLTLGRGLPGQNSYDFLALGNDVCISRQHTLIYEQGGVMLIWNLSKTNPTKLNGVVLNNPMVVQVGDRMGIGGTTFLITRMMRLES